MTALSTFGLTELDIVQNPAIGAYLIWQFTLGYQEDGAEEAPIPLAFLVLPMLLHRQTLDEVASTRKASGLPLFAAKFDKEREILMGIRDIEARSDRLRHRTAPRISARSSQYRQTKIARKTEGLRGSGR